MNRHTMLNATARLYRLMALGLLLILVMEYTEPLIARAQVQLGLPSNGTAQSPTVSQDIPSIQEVEVIEERGPFYKTWWFWILVGLVVIVGIATTTAVLAVNDSPSPGLGPVAPP